MITGINESRKLTKYILCKRECGFDSKKCNSNQKWNNEKCWCECKNLNKTMCVWKKYKFGILQHIVVKMVNMYEALLKIQWLNVIKKQKLSNNK